MENNSIKVIIFNVCNLLLLKESDRWQRKGCTHTHTEKKGYMLSINRYCMCIDANAYRVKTSLFFNVSFAMGFFLHMYPIHCLLLFATTAYGAFTGVNATECIFCLITIGKAVIERSAITDRKKQQQQQQQFHGCESQEYSMGRWVL